MSAILFDACSRLDPGYPEDVKKFKSSKTQTQYELNMINVVRDPNPHLARILIKGPWDGKSDRAKSLLSDIIKKWPTGTHVEFLVTPGAFVRFPWPDDFPPSADNLHPSKESVDALRNVAQKYCQDLIDDKMRHTLSELVDYLAIGIDSRDKERNTRYEVEFIALVDLKTNLYFWTGKSYPNNFQDSVLIRISDLSSHFMRLPTRKVLILGCHDLKMFSNRGRATAKSDWRKKVHREIDILLKNEQPEIVLHHPHTTSFSGSWKPELNELVSRFPTINYVSAGLYYNWGEVPRSTFDDVQKQTKRGAIIDFIVNSDSEI